MYKFYVYLDSKNNRLIIVDKGIENEDFLQLLDINGQEKETIHTYCKLFCIGYIIGSKEETPINDINEFI